MTKPEAYTALPFLADAKREQGDERLQEIRRGSFTRGRQTELEISVSRGMAMEEIARENMKISMDGVRAKRGMGQTVEFERARLAAGLALQGKFTEAARIAPDRNLRKRYARVAEAIQRPDSDRCACPDTAAVTVGGQEVALTPRYGSMMVPSPERHGGMVPLVVCADCGHANARPFNGRLMGHAAAMTEARRAGQRAVADAQAFKVNR